MTQVERNLTRIVQLYGTGWGCIRIAREVGMRPKYVSRLITRHVAVRRGKGRTGSLHPAWKGGKRRDPMGYIHIYSPGHPNAHYHRKSVLEHRLVMEQHLGRYLLPTEIVHHKNGVRDDNRIENLVLYAANADHLKDELAGRVPKWSPDGILRIRGKTPPREKRTLEEYRLELVRRREAILIKLIQGDQENTGLHPRTIRGYKAMLLSLPASERKRLREQIRAHSTK